MSKADSVSVRELQQHLKRVIARVERGRSVEITRHRRPVARLEPVRPDGARASWPDLEARMKKVFGGRTVAPGGSAAVVDGRGER
jgi:prevent-host-death family protein